jgi:hypothetical protein
VWCCGSRVQHALGCKSRLDLGALRGEENGALVLRIAPKPLNYGQLGLPHGLTSGGLRLSVRERALTNHVSPGRGVARSS